MKRINNYLVLGLLFNGIDIMSTRFGLLPDFVEGICVGLGITFILIGVISFKYDTFNFKAHKMSFFKNVFGK